MPPIETWTAGGGSMRPRRPTRDELREFGEDLLGLAAFLGYLFVFAAVVRYVITAPHWGDGLLVIVCVVALIVYRARRRQAEAARKRVD